MSAMRDARCAMRDARRRLSRRTSGATPHDEHAINLAARDEPARSSLPGLLKLEVHAGVTPGCQRPPRGCNRCCEQKRAQATRLPRAARVAELFAIP